jgi:pimeloyl-ACP methyl ester carboxylesterase/DNA-binding CsgD family transcriptional regulator
MTSEPPGAAPIGAGDGRGRRQVRFCTARDGVGIAFATSGDGPPIVRASNWLTHLDHDWDSPVWRHWLEFLSREHTLVRYDERGSGLSDRDVGEISLEAWVGDLEAVVDALGLGRFALVGISGGGPTAIAYAARHPERVSHLVLYGTFARGRLRRGADEAARQEAETLIRLPELGWGKSNPAFRRLFTTLFVPDASREQLDWFDELQRVSTSPETAVRMRRARAEIDVEALARRVRAPALVAHARDDAATPFAEGRRLATLIPGARLLALEGRNHILLADEPAWRDFTDAVTEFLATPGAPAAPAPADGLAELTGREREVLRLVADGLDNEAIAATLHLSARTVERHLSNVYAKLGLSGRSARAAAAARFTRSAPPSG